MSPAEWRTEAVGAMTYAFTCCGVDDPNAATSLAEEWADRLVRKMHGCIPAMTIATTRDPVSGSTMVRFEIGDKSEDVVMVRS